MLATIHPSIVVLAILVALLWLAGMFILYLGHQDSTRTKPQPKRRLTSIMGDE